MKTIQLYTSLRIRCNINLLPVTRVFRTYTQLLHPGRPEELVPERQKVSYLHGGVRHTPPLTRTRDG